MGGQACILYGAAEFTRDSDFVVSPDEINLSRLRAALSELDAKTVYVPPLDVLALQRGHACHFRCRAAGAQDWRIDVMARLRGCDDFPELWQRREKVRLRGHGAVDTLAIQDLVRAKKTQRDKDWPMIARLVEADYLNSGKRPPRQRVEFWLREARTAELLLRLVRRFPTTAARLAPQRRALAAALQPNPPAIEHALYLEQRQARRADREYWAPLHAELQRMRHAHRASRRT
jgi:hypothetical protein